MRSHFGGDRHDLIPPKLPRPALTIRKLTVQLAMDSFREWRLDSMKDWIVSLVRWTPILLSFDIRIVTWFDLAELDSWKKALTEQEWHGIRALKSLRLVAVDDWDLVEFIEGGTTAAQVVLEWSKDTNEIEELEDFVEVQDEAEDPNALADARKVVVVDESKSPERRASM